jgi:ORF6N domain
MARAKRAVSVPVEHITRSILILRGRRVILDADLAALYGVTTKRLNEQVKRNAARFPNDFMFRLTHAETETLNRSQIATSSQRHRDPRFPPYSFTEHGAIMASTILNSPRAVEMNVFVVRAFARLRELLVSNAALARKLDELERKYQHHDEAIAAILSAIRELNDPQATKRRGIGFTADIENP